MQLLFREGVFSHLGLLPCAWLAAMACPKLPCPWCVLGLQHERAPEQDIVGALQRAKENLAHGRITMLQYGMVCCAAAELLHHMRVASTPDEAMTFVAGMDKEPFNMWAPLGGSLSGSGAPPPPPPPIVPPLGAAPCGSLSAAGSGGTAVPPPPKRRDVRHDVAGEPLPPETSTSSTMANTAASQAMPSASRAASSASVWLAPDDGTSIVGDGMAPTDTTLAIVPQQPGEASGAPSLARPASVAWVWQVQTGKGRKKKWTTVCDDLAAILEHADVNNLDSCTWNWEGWVYYYEMATMTQCSPGEAGTERPIHRIPYHEAYIEV